MTIIWDQMWDKKIWNVYHYSKERVMSHIPNCLYQKIIPNDEKKKEWLEERSDAMLTHSFKILFGLQIINFNN